MNKIFAVSRWLLILIFYCGCPTVRVDAQGDPYAALASFDFGSTSDAPALIEKEFRDGGQAVYKQVETKLLAVLARPEVTYACKKTVCTHLGIVGSEACVKPLLPFLDDDRTSDIARYALESIPGRAVDSALLAALKSAKGKTQIGIIQTLAARRNKGLADILESHLSSRNPDLINASLSALARVGGEDALTVLKSAKVAEEFKPLYERSLVDAAYNVAAAGGRKKALKVFSMEYKAGTYLPAIIAAFNGQIDYGPDPVALMAGALKDSHVQLALAAVKAAMRMNNDEVMKTLVNAYPSAQPAVQVAIVRALAERGDKPGLPVIKTALASEDKVLQSEAVSACEKLGDASVFNELMSLAAAGNTGAQQALSRIKGDDVNGLLVNLLDDPDSMKVRMAITVLRLRDDQSVLPRFLRLAESDKADVRMAAVQGLEGFANESEIPRLINLLEKSGVQGEQEKIAMVLWRAARDIEDGDERFVRLWSGAGNAPESTRALILPLASAAGGGESLKIITGIMASGSDLMKERATRTLFKWQNNLALKPLVELIRQYQDAKYRILGMQAVVRILTDKRCSMSKKDKLAVLNDILPLMTRPEDKQAVESAIAKIADGSKKK